MATRAPRVLLVLTCCGISACGSSDSSSPGAPAPDVFVGPVSGTDGAVAVVAAGDRARVYFCGGPDSYESLTHWIPVSGRTTADLSAKSGAVSMAASVSDHVISGTYTDASGAAHPFTAKQPRAETIAGLYEADGECGKIALIVQQDSASAAPTAVGACVDSSQDTPSIRQVNPIGPLELAKDGTLHVSIEDSTETASLRPATL